MSKTPYEVSPEMRDFAEKSVDQARKAFDGFVGAAQKAAGSVEGSTATAQTNVKDMGTKAMTFAHTSVNAAFDLANKMVKAKDINEILALQSEYVKAQMAAIQGHAKELGETVQQAVTPKK